jgi:hypothetical protein
MGCAKVKVVELRGRHRRDGVRRGLVAVTNGMMTDDWNGREWRLAVLLRINHIGGKEIGLQNNMGTRDTGGRGLVSHMRVRS